MGDLLKTFVTSKIFHRKLQMLSQKTEERWFSTVHGVIFYDAVSYKLWNWFTKLFSLEHLSKWPASTATDVTAYSPSTRMKKVKFYRSRHKLLSLISNNIYWVQRCQNIKHYNEWVSNPYDVHVFSEFLWQTLKRFFKPFVNPCRKNSLSQGSHAV